MSSISLENLKSYVGNGNWYLLGSPESKFLFPLRIDFFSWGCIGARDVEEKQYFILDDPIKITEGIDKHTYFEANPKSVVSLTLLSHEDARRIHEAVKASLVSLELFYV